jgi:hypothetical protein
VYLSSRSYFDFGALPRFPPDLFPVFDGRFEVELETTWANVDIITSFLAGEIQHHMVVQLNHRYKQALLSDEDNANYLMTYLALKYAFNYVYKILGPECSGCFIRRGKP